MRVRYVRFRYVRVRYVRVGLAWRSIFVCIFQTLANTRRIIPCFIRAILIQQPGVSSLGGPAGNRDLSPWYTGCVTCPIGKRGAAGFGLYLCASTATPAAAWSLSLRRCGSLPLPPHGLYGDVPLQRGLREQGWPTSPRSSRAED